MEPESHSSDDTERKELKRRAHLLDAENTLEALHAAELPTDAIEWVTDVLKTGLPGEARWGNLHDLDKLSFDAYDDTDIAVQALITRGRQLWAEAYKNDIHGTIVELNEIITHRPGLFVVNQTTADTLKSISASWDDVGHASLVTHSTIGEIEGVIDKLYIDESLLLAVEQRAIRAYRAALEL